MVSMNGLHNLVTTHVLPYRLDQDAWMGKRMRDTTNVHQMPTKLPCAKSEDKDNHRIIKKS